MQHLRPGRKQSRRVRFFNCHFTEGAVSRRHPFSASDLRNALRASFSKPLAFTRPARSCPERSRGESRVNHFQLTRDPGLRRVDGRTNPT
jgi:hypothetical protein